MTQDKEYDLPEEKVDREHLTQDGKKPTLEDDDQ